MTTIFFYLISEFKKIQVIIIYNKFPHTCVKLHFLMLLIKILNYLFKIFISWKENS